MFVCNCITKIIRYWYNLEKSSRVKAFRCGEFDSCIKKAESSKTLTYTRSLKYAHREDAILHALELEKQDLEKLGRQGILAVRLIIAFASLLYWTES